METITYTPLTGYKTSNVVLGTMLALLGSLLLCVSCLAPVVALTSMPPNWWGDPILLSATSVAILCGSLLGLLPLGFGVRLLFFAKPNAKIELTEEALIYKQGRKVTKVQLAELKKLATRIEYTKRGVKYWVIRLQDQQDAFIDLDVSQDEYVGLFDAQAIVRDTLNRLRTPAQMEMRIKKFLETGRLE